MQKKTKMLADLEREYQELKTEREQLQKKLVAEKKIYEKKVAEYEKVQSKNILSFSNESKPIHKTFLKKNSGNLAYHASKDGEKPGNSKRWTLK